MPRTTSARVRVGDTVIRLTTDGNAYCRAGSRVIRIEVDEDFKGCTVLLRDEGTNHETTKRGRFNRKDGSATLTQTQPMQLEET